MTTPCEPNCSKRECRHFLGVLPDDRLESPDIMICTAFPKGIPDVIAYGPNLHLKPFPGDHGIQFECDASK